MWSAGEAGLDLFAQHCRGGRAVEQAWIEDDAHLRKMGSFDQKKLANCLRQLSTRSWPGVRQVLMGETHDSTNVLFCQIRGTERWPELGLLMLHPTSSMQW